MHWQSLLIRDVGFGRVTLDDIVSTQQPATTKLYSDIERVSSQVSLIAVFIKIRNIIIGQEAWLESEIRVMLC